MKVHRLTKPITCTAQTDIKDAGTPSADDFLARERALLGDDATQFATNDDDLLGGDSGADQQTAETSQFETQFPDITNEVCSIPPPGARNKRQGFNMYILFCRESDPAVASPAHQ